MPVWFGDRKIYVNTMKTQTVKVCDGANVQGRYEWKVRLSPPHVMTVEALEAEIRQRASVPKPSIPDLIGWLNGEKNGDIEIAPGPFPIATPPESVPEETTVLPPPPNDAWLQRARQVVDHAIDEFIREFVQFPYLHRVEHSIHARLFEILAAQPLFSRHYPLGKGLGFSQLVHKEWPETKPRPEKGNRRGNFDLAVLSPELLQQCPALPQFLEGYLAAPIVIEIGLDYDCQHLTQDQTKLLNSAVPCGYLIHLVRDQRPDPREEDLILRPLGNGCIKTAFARIAGNQRSFKLVNDQKISMA